VAALRELQGAAQHGLVADDYDTAALRQAVAAASAAGASPDVVARADVALTSAVLRFLADLRFGRVRPQEVEPHFRAQAKDAGFVTALRSAVAYDRLGALVAATEPAFALYGRLVLLLAHYRGLAAQPPIVLPGLPPLTTKIVAGDRYAGVEALHDLLVRLGDLRSDAARPAGDRYDADLAAAVGRFQSRHGLDAAGVLGKQTLVALNVPLATRVTQIELSLERLRWLPELAAGPVIAINVPSFHLWAFRDAADTQTATLSMPVIVGQAVRNQTPIFIGEMRAVEFSPYWNVPRNILHNELLPRLARDPGYLQREDMELVSTRGGAAARTVDAESLAGLRQGDLRLRQRPGTKNALGDVKFVLPNTMEIYLHGTPARQLFERTRRDFSHGCIRVRDPEALAAFVLQGLPEWTPATIAAAMGSGQNRTVALPRAIPVIVFYTTAIVDRAGRALFLPDVYGHDTKLAAALRS
jgi:murein L,D-transpeptidase YcbB/YkuD